MPRAHLHRSARRSRPYSGRPELSVHELGRGPLRRDDEHRIRQRRLGDRPDAECAQDRRRRQAHPLGPRGIGRGDHPGPLVQRQRQLEVRLRRRSPGLGSGAAVRSAPARSPVWASARPPRRSSIASDDGHAAEGLGVRAGRGEDRESRRAVATEDERARPPGCPARRGTRRRRSARSAGAPRRTARAPRRSGQRGSRPGQGCSGTAPDRPGRSPTARAPAPPGTWPPPQRAHPGRTGSRRCCSGRCRRP